MNFEVDLIFHMKPFFSMAKKSRQKFKYLESKMIFIDFITVNKTTFFARRY